MVERVGSKKTSGDDQRERNRDILETCAGPAFQAVTKGKGRSALAKQVGRCRGDIDILYEFLSSSVGISVMATSNLAWILSRISISVAFETKVNARPLVPKRPARL